MAFRFAMTFIGVLSALMCLDGCKPRQDRSGVSTAQDSSTSAAAFVVPKSSFSKNVMDYIQANRLDQQELIKQRETGKCGRTEAFVKRVMERIESASNLQDAVKQIPPLQITIACSVKVVGSAEMKAGILSIYPDLLRGLPTEDHVAAVLAHELMHYTRSHDEELVAINQGWTVFKAGPIDKAKARHEIEADRLSVTLLKNAGFDPYAAVELPLILDKFLARETLWREGQSHPLYGTMQDRSDRMKAEFDSLGLVHGKQAPGELPAVLEELAKR